MSSPTGLTMGGATGSNTFKIGQSLTEAGGLDDNLKTLEKAAEKPTQRPPPPTSAVQGREDSKETLKAYGIVTRLVNDFKSLIKTGKGRNEVQKREDAIKRDCTPHAKALEDSSKGMLKADTLISIRLAISQGKPVDAGNTAIALAAQRGISPSQTEDMLRFLEKTTTGDQKEAITQAREKFSKENESEIGYNRHLETQAQSLHEDGKTEASTFSQILKKIPNDPIAGTLELLEHIVKGSSLKRGSKELNVTMHKFGEDTKAAIKSPNSDNKAFLVASVKIIKSEQAALQYCNIVIGAHRDIGRQVERQNATSAHV